MTTIDPHGRARAARHLLDVLSSFDVDDAGSESAEGRYKLALEPLGLDLDDEPVAELVSAAVDLLLMLAMAQAHLRDASVEAVISTLRAHLPNIYPEVYPPPLE